MFRYRVIGRCRLGTRVWAKTQEGRITTRYHDSEANENPRLGNLILARPSNTPVFMSSYTTEYHNPREAPILEPRLQTST